MHLPANSTAVQRPGRAARGGVVGAFLLLLGPSVAGAQMPAPPVLGEGPVQVGGYGAITFSRPEHPETVERLEVSELALALLGWGRITQNTGYLIELDMAKRTTATWTGREADEWLAPVRLYVEYAARDLLRVRMGRFLTPIGEWNERHAEPLTWTPTRPLTTYRPFAKSATGLLIAGEGSLAGRDWGYAAFWAPGTDLDRDIEEAEESAFTRALGVRVAAEPASGLTVGLSAARLRRSQPLDSPEPSLTAAPQRAAVVRWSGGRESSEEREEDALGRSLVGVDLRWERADVELALEGNWLLAHEGVPGEGGIFGSAAARLRGPLWAVVRAESYQPVDDRSARVAYAGLTARFSTHVAVKFGRQFTEHPSTRIPDGWFLSFLSLF